MRLGNARDYDYILLTYQVGLNTVIFPQVIIQVHWEGAVSSLQRGEPIKITPSPRTYILAYTYTIEDEMGRTCMYIVLGLHEMGLDEMVR